MWSIQNIVRVALVQIAVVIASILTAGVYHKWSAMNELGMPPYENWWYQYGILGFGLPIIWVAWSLYLYTQDEISDAAKYLLFWLGVLAAVVLAFLTVNSLLNLFTPDIRM